MIAGHAAHAFAEAVVDLAGSETAMGVRHAPAASYQRQCVVLRIR
ncbi:hypothetical protein [Bradyrhizobium betae]|nr:hypothetical protein [Bradyrhizobium betae]